MLIYFPKKQVKFIPLNGKCVFNADLFPQNASEIYFSQKQLSIYNADSFCQIASETYFPKKQVSL